MTTGPGPVHGAGGGEARARCGAPLRGERAGRTCVNPPMRGQSRCRMHGASTPVALAAAARRQELAAAERAVQTYGLRRDVAPEDALLEEIQWSAGHVAWLRLQVQALDAGALVWGETERRDVQSGEFGGVDTTQAAQPSVWWVLYERERKLLLALVHEAGVQKIEDRRIRLAERQGTHLAERGRAYVAGVIDALGLDQRSAEPVMLRLFAEMLRQLSGGDALAVTA